MIRECNGPHVWLSLLASCPAGRFSKSQTCLNGGKIEVDACEGALLFSRDYIIGFIIINCKFDQIYAKDRIEIAVRL